METRKAQRNGNSVAINLPTQYAAGAGISVGTLCVITLDVNKRIIIQPYREPSSPEAIR